MAEKKATLILELKDLATSGINGVVGGLQKLKASFLAVSTAVAGLTAFLASSVKAYMEQENANERLNQALKTQGVYTQQTAKDLQNYALQLQRVTTFSDETILETMALLTTFGVTGDTLKQSVVAAMDLAVARGLDLNSVTMMLGKAFQGQTEALSRYGIVVDKNMPQHEKFNAILKQLAVNAGTAESRLNTTSGQIQNFSNRVGELKERIGAMLIPVLTKFLDNMSTIISVFEDLANSPAKVQRGLATLGQLFLEFGKILFDVFIAPLESISFLLEKFGIDLDTVRAAAENSFNNLSGQLEQWAVKSEETARRNEEANRKINVSKANQVAVHKTLTAEEIKERTKFYADVAKMDQDALNANLEWENKKTQVAKEAQKLREQNLESSLNFIAQMSTAKNKALAAIGKAAGISTATIDTYVAANKALASAPPPWNFALMAAVIAAGITNVARISGIALAQGGMILPTNGGTLATIGEGGRAEAVIPLDDPRTAQKLMQSGFGGGVTVNVGILVGNENNVRDLARMIDEELFMLDRAGQRISA